MHGMTKYEAVALPYHQEVIIDDMTKNTGDSRIEPISLNTLQECEEREEEIGPRESQHSAEPAPARTENSIPSVFETYFAREFKKLQHRPELFPRHHGHMEPYQEALSSIKAAHDTTLANMAVAIGDCSAMIILQQAIASIRAPLDGDSFHVSQDMSSEQRLKAIMHLDLRIAHLNLAHRLHVHKLYEHLSSQIPGGDAGGLVLLSNADLGPSLSESRAAAPRGNPRHRRQANITTLMTDRVHADNSSGGDRRKSRTYMKRLRRLGRRLQLLVHRWGLGILYLLGAGFTDDLIMATTDAVFVQFIDVVNRIEGHTIRAVSNVAAAAVHLFTHDSLVPLRLLIEGVEEDVLHLLPRLSREMQALFTTADAV
ncbi:hypothetical protein B0A55_12485 [Friedmanniomyces simplex]|uniref:Uncharacterized protein n=1 Tax=Friedmanniomyces simplex TaxID=329884 RepID=A0A4U0WJ26_9PEZI|nr:hypothetical protein B0A55_12485 [Friedmanniomyces simplex]